MRWFTSDTHFFHENIIKFCGREYEDVDKMNEGIIKIWNEYVKPEDIVYHAGDYSFKIYSKKDLIRKITKRLNGFKILGLGNHDSKDTALYFGLDLVTSSAYINLDGIDFKLTHFPYQSAMPESDKINRPECFTNLEYNKSTKAPFPLICGHVHDAWVMKDGCLNVGWDIWKRPISEIELIKLYNETNGFQNAHTS